MSASRTPSPRPKRACCATDSALTLFYYCLIAEQDGHPAGFALYFFNYSTWMGRPGIYLEDLFVQPEFRGLGIGKALLQQVAAIAVEKRLPAPAMGGPGLEYPGHRLL